MILNGVQFVSCINERISYDIHILDTIRYICFNELFVASLFSISLNMHGLILKTSICYWQDQPDRTNSPLRMSISVKFAEIVVQNGIALPI